MENMFVSSETYFMHSFPSDFVAIKNLASVKQHKIEVKKLAKRGMRFFGGGFSYNFAVVKKTARREAPIIMISKTQITRMIDEGRIAEAKHYLSEIIEGIDGRNNADWAHYLLGNIHYKACEWKEAIEHYLEAIEINAQSPAKEKLKMTYEILSFYNKDIYGQ